MKALLTAVASSLLVALAATAARAEAPCGAGGCGPTVTPAPAASVAPAAPMCGPGGCMSGGYGMGNMPAPPPVYPYGGGPWNAPCYNVRPCFPPFNGVLPPMNNGGGNMGGCPLPTHPYVRAPRDYFMFYDR